MPTRRGSATRRESARRDFAVNSYAGDRVCGVPMLDQGVWAEVKVGGEHLRLFSEQSAQGVQASVYNVNAKTWIAPSESVEDIEEGKDRAAGHATTYLLRVANSELPPLIWKKSRSA